MDPLLDRKKVEAICNEIRSDHKDAFASRSIHIFAGGGHEDGDDVVEHEAYTSFGIPSCEHN